MWRGAVRLHQVFEHLAHGGGRRPHHRLCASGELSHGVLHALLHLRTGEVEVDVVVERDRHHRQPDFRDGADSLRARKAEHRYLHRIADLLLCLDG